MTVMANPTSPTVQTNPGTQPVRELRAGMAGLGMIFDETYRPFFEQAGLQGIFDPAFGVCRARLAAVSTRTGKRAETYRRAAPPGVGDSEIHTGAHSGGLMAAGDVDFD